MKSEKANKRAVINAVSSNLPQIDFKSKYAELRDLYHDLQQKNHALTIANERLFLQNREKDRFMDIASHDFQLPLSAISMMSEALVKKELLSGSVEETRVFGMIQDACLELKSLLANYLSANLSETGRMKLFFSEVDIGFLTGGIVNRYAHFAAKKAIQLHFNTTENFLVRTDRECCAQIIENLLSNAIKYTGHGKNVTVLVMDNQEETKIVVADEGPGISEEEQHLLFKRFQKLSPRPTGGELSTGLGLSIVKYLAEQLQGSISVESEPGKGSVFTLHLPNAQL
jgi:signal transduction histidine kinase